VEYRVNSPKFLLHVFQYYYLNIKILKFYENWCLKYFEKFEILWKFEIWNFWIFWSFHIFWKFWTLNFKFFFFILEFWIFFLNFRNFEIFWNFWNFENFEVLKFFVQRKKGSKVSSIVCRAKDYWRVNRSQGSKKRKNILKYVVT
jgi:hypothetical protein